MSLLSNGAIPQGEQMVSSTVLICHHQSLTDYLNQGDHQQPEEMSDSPAISFGFDSRVKRESQPPYFPLAFLYVSGCISDFVLISMVDFLLRLSCTPPRGRPGEYPFKPLAEYLLFFTRWPSSRNRLLTLHHFIGALSLPDMLPG